MRNDMKRLILAPALPPPPSPHAAPVDMPALRAYVTKAMTRCPTPVLTIEPISQGGPQNFLIYEANLRSSDENCNSRKYVLSSPTTQQVIIGTIIALPNDPRPANVRIAEQTSEMMKTPLQATVSPFPLPDALKAVTISKNTDYGPFIYHTFLDGSERFMIVGSRRHLRLDPGNTLLENLRATTSSR